MSGTLLTELMYILHTWAGNWKGEVGEVEDLDGMMR